MTTCTTELRTGPCALTENHRGRHSTVGFYCEACGKVRRGQPHQHSVVRLGDGTIDDQFSFCFLCTEVFGGDPDW